MAYVCYTSHGKFTYKGTQNDDVDMVIFREELGKFPAISAEKNDNLEYAFGTLQRSWGSEDIFP